MTTSFDTIAFSKATIYRKELMKIDFQYYRRNKYFKSI